MTTTTDIIATARYVLNDVATDPASYRNSDAELLGYINEATREVSFIRPDLFSTIGDMPCVASVCEQLVTFADAQKITAVLAIHGGAALTEFDAKAMDAFTPSWRAATPGVIKQWARYDALRFFVYPPPSGTQSVDVAYVKNPTVLVDGDTISQLPSGMMPAIADYVVYRAEAKDDEHVGTGRAAAMYAAFVAKVKAS